MLHTLLNYIRAFNNFLLFFVIFSILVFSKHDHLSFTLFIETLTNRFYFRNSDLFVNIIILYIISIKSSLIYYNNIIVRFVRLICFETSLLLYSTVSVYNTR